MIKVDGLLLVSYLEKVATGIGNLVLKMADIMGSQKTLTKCTLPKLLSQSCFALTIRNTKVVKCSVNTFFLGIPEDGSSLMVLDGHQLAGSSPPGYRIGYP
jgi:hypothetical protein